MTSAALALTLGLTTGGGRDSDDAPAPAPIVTFPVGDTIALTTSGRLISFNRATPSSQVGSVAVTGLAGTETLLGIDIRPVNGVLYALGSNGGIYRIDPATGVTSLSSTLRAAAGDDDPFTGLSGTSFGIDFNPVPNRLRMISNTGQNLRINV